LWKVLAYLTILATLRPFKTLSFGHCGCIIIIIIIFSVLFSLVIMLNIIIIEIFKFNQVYLTFSLIYCSFLHSHALSFFFQQLQKQCKTIYQLISREIALEEDNNDVENP